MATMSLDDNLGLVLEIRDRPVYLNVHEQAILSERLQGEDKEWIAANLGLGLSTVGFYLNNLQAKIGVCTEVALLHHCYQSQELLAALFDFDQSINE